ncbi:MAG: hypothetical protein U0835_06015 [Isosphaeraceae bacterium]
MATEARIFRTPRQKREAVRRLKAAGVPEAEIGAGTCLVTVVTDGETAERVRKILESVADGES